MKKIVLVAHNIRSTHNVGAILRTADAMAVDHVIMSGYTPYPKLIDDTRLPHIADKNTKDIAKSALGAERSMHIKHANELIDVINTYRNSGYAVIALEQDQASEALQNFSQTKDVLLILGEERYGIPPDILERCDVIVELPMLGTKESLNVSVAAGIALYQLRYG